MLIFFKQLDCLFSDTKLPENSSFLKILCLKIITMHNLISNLSWRKSSSAVEMQQSSEVKNEKKMPPVYMG